MHNRLYQFRKVKEWESVSGQRLAVKSVTLQMALCQEQVSKTQVRYEIHIGKMECINSLMQSLYSEAYSRSTSKYIPRILWNLKVHYMFTKACFPGQCI
jgi:hypothetical protein